MSGHNAPVLSENRKRELFSFQSKVGLSYNDISLLNNAFIHSSYANEVRNGASDNERLEFLGDSVLSVVVSEWLYRNLQGDEGVKVDSISPELKITQLCPKTTYSLLTTLDSLELLNGT